MNNLTRLISLTKFDTKTCQVDDERLMIEDDDKIGLG